MGPLAKQGADTHCGSAMGRKRTSPSVGFSVVCQGLLLALLRRGCPNLVTGGGNARSLTFSTGRDPPGPAGGRGVRLAVQWMSVREPVLDMSE